MLRAAAAAVLLSSATASSLALAPPQPPTPVLMADEIVERSVKASGGLEAWKAIDTITVYGYIDHGSSQTRFVIQMKRDHKQRIDFNLGPGGLLTYVYDGRHGWKMRAAQGKQQVLPYSESDLRAAVLHQDLDGPLIGYAAKGYAIALEGTEQVAGHSAYRLKVTEGHDAHHVWVDAKSFLEVKAEEDPRVVEDKTRQVNTYFEDYRSVQGVMVPFIEETVAEGTQHKQRRVIEQVDFNKTLDDNLFGRPPGQEASPPAEHAKHHTGSLADLVRRKSQYPAMTPASPSGPAAPAPAAEAASDGGH